jgi:hypothetical protein
MIGMIGVRLQLSYFGEEGELEKYSLTESDNLVAGHEEI